MLTPDRQESLTPAQGLGPGTVLRGRFLLQEPLEHGRFGLVYKALDRQSVGWDGAAGYVSVLILPTDISSNPRALAAVRENVARLRSLAHESIVSVFDFDADGDLHFVVLEYVDGESLRTVLDNLAPERLWQEEALEVVRAVGAALHYAHERGFVHGDVRPENVIVRSAKDVKLLFASTCLLRNVAPFATEPRDDVFGLACLAYELLAGMPPFAGGGSAAVRAAREPRRIKGLPRRQWDALRAALAPHDRRTRSVARFLADMRLEARPVRETKRRQPRTGAAFAFLTLLASLAAVGYLNRDTLRALLVPGAASDRLLPEPLSPAPPTGGPAVDAGDDAVAEQGAEGPPASAVVEAPATAAEVEAASGEGDAATPSDAGGTANPSAEAADAAASAPAEQNAGGTRAADATASPTAGASAPGPAAAATAEPPASGTDVSPAPTTEPAQRAPATEPPSTVANGVKPERPTRDAADARPQPAAEPRPTAPAPRSAFGFAVSEIVVSERSTAVAVDIVRLAGSGAASVAWWTSDGTAVGGEDYADFGAVIERFEPGERRRTIYIPITADGTPEDREWFHVNLNDAPDGNRSPAGNVKRATVTIVDDDR
ncbi:MAG TPA: protein kinase [Gammaproteobacteria bacterium]